MKILVTGGAGFIGSHVVDAYVGAGHDVVVVDDLSSGKETNLNPRARFYKADICVPEIEEIFQVERFDLVNHHAAQIDVRRSVADPAEDARINILGGLNVLGLAVRHAVQQFIFASTGGAIYGEAAIPTPESHPANPVNPYGVAKLAMENYLRAFQVTHGLRYLVLRYTNVYGPRQDAFGEAGVVAMFSGRLLTGKSPMVFGGGEQTRDYVFVGDVARANLLALHRLACTALNVGTGIETSVNELLDRLRAVSGVKADARHQPARAGELRRSAVNPKRARDLLGWTPEIGLEEGLRQTFDWFAERHACRV